MEIESHLTFYTLSVTIEIIQLIIMNLPTNVPLDTNQIRFILDMMMGCPLGHTSSYSRIHDVSAEDLYNHLEAHLKAADAELSTGK